MPHNVRVLAPFPLLAGLTAAPCQGPAESPLPKLIEATLDYHSESGRLVGHPETAHERETADTKLEGPALSGAGMTDSVAVRGTNSLSTRMLPLKPL